TYDRKKKKRKKKQQMRQQCFTSKQQIFSRKCQSLFKTINYQPFGMFLPCGPILISCSFRCVAASWAKYFSLRHDRLKQIREELTTFLQIDSKSPSLSSPSTSGNGSPTGTSTINSHAPQAQG